MVTMTANHPQPNMTARRPCRRRRWSIQRVVIMQVPLFLLIWALTFFLLARKPAKISPQPYNNVARDLEGFDNFINLRRTPTSTKSSKDSNRTSRPDATSDTPSRNTRSNKPPLIIVPGAMGSLLEAKLHKNQTVSRFCSKETSDWYTLWISESALVASSCFFDNIKMRYVGQGKVIPAKGVDVRVPNYGTSMEGVRCILPHTKAHCAATRNWMDIINGLIEIGNYRTGEDLFAAPYDFRRGPDDYMEDDYPKLQKLVEVAYAKNNNTKVALASISLGSMFVHTFLTHFVDQNWKDTYIDRWLTMSGTFNGFAQSFLNVVFGRTQFLGWSFQQTDIRDAYRSWPSAMWLIPKPIYGDNRVLLETPSHNYTLSEIGKQILRGDQANMYERSFRYNMSSDPGVPTTCWYGNSGGTEGKTIVGYILDHDFTERDFYSDTGILNIQEIYASKGDGTVDEQSLSICERWKSAWVHRFKHCHGCFLVRKQIVQNMVNWIVGRKN